MTTIELRDLLDANLSTLGCNDIQTIESELEQIETELKLQRNAKTLSEVRFYSEQVQSRKNFILNLMA